MKSLKIKLRIKLEFKKYLPKTKWFLKLYVIFRATKLLNF